MGLMTEPIGGFRSPGSGREYKQDGKKQKSSKTNPKGKTGLRRRDQANGEELSPRKARTQQSKD